MMKAESVKCGRIKCQLLIAVEQTSGEDFAGGVNKITSTHIELSEQKAEDEVHNFISHTIFTGFGTKLDSKSNDDITSMG
jgi:hypothetical protein